LRPHIVWFGEAVPEIENAAKVFAACDILLVIGTSLLVYPAAGLINYAPYDAQKWLIDPAPANTPRIPNLRVIAQKATLGVHSLVTQLIAEA